MGRCPASSISSVCFSPMSEVGRVLPLADPASAVSGNFTPCRQERRSECPEMAGTCRSTFVLKRSTLAGTSRQQGPKWDQVQYLFLFRRVLRNRLFASLSYIPVSLGPYASCIGMLRTRSFTPRQEYFPVILPRRDASVQLSGA